MSFDIHIQKVVVRKCNIIITLFEYIFGVLPFPTGASLLPLQRWRDEPRYHLQASRSADRLHVPQVREVSRKMSTNSEYAVITYA